MKKFIPLLTAFIVLFVLAGFFQNESWFNYAVIIPLIYIAYNFIKGTINFLKKYDF